MRRMMTTALLALGVAAVGVPPARGQDWVAAKCDLPGAGH